MTDWLILIGYIVGFVPSWRWLSRRMLEGPIAGTAYGKIGKDDRTLAKAVGFLLSLLWPFIVPIWLVFIALNKLVFPNDVQAKKEVEEAREKAEAAKKKADEAEIARLRKLLKDYDLPGWEV